MKYSVFSRERLIAEARKDKKWDLVIIGGGATGLGIALDAVTRGYSTLLLEQEDFAKGTSSRSTKLVHGGIRYLAQGNIDLVREALHERGLLAINAPHLVKKQKFIIPNYLWWEGLYYNFGLKTYDFLAGKLSMGKSERISLEEVNQRLPALVREELRGGVIYLDGQFDDARLAVNIAQTIVENDGIALNHLKVTGISSENADVINRVQARDSETGETYSFKANLVVNATGVFVDDIRKMANPGAKASIKASQGVHLVFDQKFFPGKDALMIPKTDDGRVLFAVPWNGKVLVGTTDTLLENPVLEPKALEEEIEFIMKTFNRYIQKKVTRKDVKSVFAGLRPLAVGEGEDKSTKEISRGHKIDFSEKGLLTITGGKWTTYRKMAEDVIDLAITENRLPARKCITENFLIHGAKSHKSREDHLHVYGGDKSLILELIDKHPNLGERIHPDLPHLEAEVVWAVRFEMARSLEDVLARRVRILFLDARIAQEIAPKVAALMAKELEKDENWINEQVENFRKLVEEHYQVSSEKHTKKDKIQP
ncbi:glycerol-3-phosphate dehydrogenase/oxidase [Christiangramia aestuarii]|uniref:glycerol-3-phosphate dehydrogenase/oxidase n=1 Tax=Christiangramia aestuarii TaxID=1028746 RepID=UPI00192E3BCF|nr:glycerol-3-phosphate dehydrogenase/oxidase [Christiangramia aestuarii]